MPDHEELVGIAGVLRGGEGEAGEVEAVVDEVGALAEVFGDLLEPAGDDDLFERRFPGVEDAGFRAGPGFKVLDEIEAAAPGGGIVLGPLGGFPGGGDDDVGVGDVFGGEREDPKEIDGGRDVEPGGGFEAAGEFVAEVEADGLEGFARTEAGERLVDAEEGGMDDGDVMSAGGEVVGVFVGDFEAADGVGAGRGSRKVMVSGCCCEAVIVGESFACCFGSSLSWRVASCLADGNK